MGGSPERRADLYANIPIIPRQLNQQVYKLVTAVYISAISSQVEQYYRYVVNELPLGLVVHYLALGHLQPRGALLVAPLD